MIVIAGAGAIGASVAYQLALRGTQDVVLCDVGEVAGGSTSRAMGGVRQQFSTAAEVRLARESIAFFEELGTPFFEQVGYLFVATTEGGLAALEERLAVQTELGVPVERVDPSFVSGPSRRRSPRRRLLRAGRRRRSTRGRAGMDPPRRRRRGGGSRAHRCGRARLAGRHARDRLRAVVGGGRSRVGVELPVRPLCRQLLATAPLPSLPARLPMVIEEETGFHFRRRGRAARARDGRRGSALGLRDRCRRDGVRGPAGAAARIGSRPPFGSRSRMPGPGSTT